MNILESKKGLIDKDLQEMEKRIAPNYQQASKNMQTLKTYSAIENCSFESRGTFTQRKDAIIQDIQSEMDDMKSEIDAQ